MPPRSPASSLRRGGGAPSRTRNAEERHQQRATPPPPPAVPAAAGGLSPSCRAMTTITPSAEPTDQGGGDGSDGSGSSFPVLFPASESPASEAGSDTSDSSSTSSSSVAILALGEREEADSRDELIGIFVPALDPAEGGRGGRARPSPLLLGDRKVNENKSEAAEVRPDMSASSSTSSSCSTISTGNNATSARRMGHHRALSSTCLEGLEPASHHHRRERSGSLLDPPRSREYSGDHSTDLLDCSGAPSDREHSSSLYRQYSNEASAPPPQVLQGWKMNCVALDKRSWLEVRDKQHRYGKNLRLYFKEWDRRGKPGGSFFTWLSTPEVQLDGCPRHELESDVVHYCRPEERDNYALSLKVTREGQAMLYTAEGEPVNCGPNAWLFVLRDQTIFATDKKTDPPRFHHSSFFGGGYVEAAGMLVAEKGVLKTLYPHSGHYRPTNQHLQGLLKFLRGLGVDLSALQVDAQRVHKVARPDKRTSFPRVRKMDNPFMVSALYLLDFFEAKYLAWSSSIFDELHRKVTERHERLHKHNHRHHQHQSPESVIPTFLFDGSRRRGSGFGSTTGVGGDSDGESVCWGVGGRSESSTATTIGSDVMVSGVCGGGVAALKPPAGGAEGEGGGGGRPAEETAAGEQEGSGGDSGLGGGSPLLPSPSSCPPGPALP